VLDFEGPIQGRKTRRPSGAGAGQVRAGNQPQNCQGPRPYRPRNAVGHCGRDYSMKRQEFIAVAPGEVQERGMNTRGQNRRSFSCTGSRTTYTSTTVCLLTSRRRAGSCYLIFSGGAVRISRPATLTPPTIKSVTSTPSSPNWGRASRPRRARRLGPTGHRLGTGLPRARGRAGVVEHVLLRNADAPATGGDLALLHARDQKRREACVTDVRELTLPPDVLVAGWEVHPRRGCQT
jgi:hypothetical protein